MTSRQTYIGVATPQANPTVELEFRDFFRGPVCAQVTRLTSVQENPGDRLCEYMRQIPAALASYDTLPLAAFAFACTGSAYLLGADFEQALTASLATEHGFPLVTATQAIDNELRVRGVRRIAILAPYPENLCAAANDYWEDKGFEITTSRRIATGDDTRAIYELTDNDVARAIDNFDTGDAELLLLSGTGMPSIAALHRRGIPIISSNFCLATEVLRRVNRWPADQPANIDKLCGLE